MGISKKKNGIGSIFLKGDLFTKLSFVIFGLSNIVHGQIVKGLLFLAIEIAYILYMVQTGFGSLEKLLTLGTEGQGMVFNEAIGIFEFSHLNESEIQGVSIREISNRTVPEDFRNKRIHRCWKMVKPKAE